MDPKTAREIGRRLGMTKKAGPPTAGARPAGEWGEGITAETLKQDPTFTGAVRKTPFAGSSWGNWARGVPQRERAYQWTGAGSHAPIPASAYDPTNLRHFRGYESDPTGAAGRFSAQQAWTPAMKNYPQYKAPAGGAVTAPGGMSQEADGAPAVVTPKTPGAQDAEAVAKVVPGATNTPPATTTAKAQPTAMPTFSPETLAYFKQHNFDPASIAGGAAGGAGVEGDLYKMDPKARAAHIRQQSMMYTGMTPAQYSASNDAMLAGLGRAHQARQTRRWIQNLFSAV